MVKCRSLLPKIYSLDSTQGRVHRAKVSVALQASCIQALHAQRLLNDTISVVKLFGNTWL